MRALSTKDSEGRCVLGMGFMSQAVYQPALPHPNKSGGPTGHSCLFPSLHTRGKKNLPQKRWLLDLHLSSTEESDFLFTSILIKLGLYKPSLLPLKEGWSQHEITLLARPSP